MSVDVSPDGQHIVFDLLGDLYLLPIAGGEAKPLTHSMAWRYKRASRLMVRKFSICLTPVVATISGLMNVDGSDAKALTKEDFRLLNNPVWHPNGQYFAARRHYSGTRSLGFW